MAGRRKIGLFYIYDENWIGGAYYIQNLVNAFNTLEDARRPVVVLYSHPNEFESFKKITEYPYLMHATEYEPAFSFVERVINRVARTLLKRPLISKKKFPLDVLFPVFDAGDERNGKPANLHWIPDFQEHYLPEFFYKEEIERRIKIQETVSAREGALLLLSSQAAFADYKRIYPEARTKNHIVPFAVSHPAFRNRDIDTIREKYSIPIKYYICSNQFWAHKNHRVVIEAVRILKEQGVEACVIFTGKENDWRNPDFFGQLRALADQSGVKDLIRFLGLIDRLDQLQLMKHAEAVIQPSRFEGWSTVIEDAKAMDQLVIASDIPVHKEQLKTNGYFFDVMDPAELAGIIKIFSQNRPKAIPNNYGKKIREFATHFLGILESN